jgi:hypothetical protein
MIPVGARKIIDARMAGRRPELPVVVSFLGSLDIPNPVVYPNRLVNDWRFLFGLAVICVVKPGPDVRDDLVAIVGQAAPYVALIEPERKLASSILSLNPVQLWVHTSRHPIWQAWFA